MKNENDISVYNSFLLNNVLIIIGYFIHDKIISFTIEISIKILF